MSTEQVQEQTITVDGVVYGLSQFSQAVKNGVALYQTWSTELEKAKLEVYKLESAINNQGNAVTLAVKQELAAKVAESEGPSTEVPAAE